MKHELLKEMYEMEKNYWWHKAKRLYIFLLMKKFGKAKTPKILDVGCGTGYLIKEMETFGEVHGIDNSKISLSFCRKRGLKNLRLFDIEKKAFARGRFDIATALDVIEHIKDDKKAMKNIYQSLKKDGILIVAVPAYQSLWTYWDEAAGHHRRYGKESIRELFEKTGFRVEYIRFANFLPFFPAFAIRFIKSKSENKKSVSSDFIKLPGFLNELVFQIMRLEIAISFLLPPICGLSLIVVGRKVR